MDSNINELATIMLLVDWETDKWVRIYAKVQRDASLGYTFSKTSAKEGKYPERIDKIKNTSLKSPTLSDTRLNSERRVSENPISEMPLTESARQEGPSSSRATMSRSLKNYLKIKI
jgi:hypothetical protein